MQAIENFGGIDTIEEYRRIQSWYRRIELQFDVRHPSNTELRYLCDAKDNLEQEIYSWYNLKESFSHSLPFWVLNLLKQEYGFNPTRVLDPFAGSGTTLLSLSQRGIPVFGVEYNPFIAWVSKVKLNWQRYDSLEIRKVIDKISLEYKSSVQIDCPPLSTLSKEEYFKPEDIQLTLQILDRIESVDSSVLVKDFLKLGIASILEDISNLRKDGRALRYVPKKRKESVQTLLRNAWDKQLNHLNQVQQNWENIAPAQVYKGSAVNLSKLQDIDSKASIGLSDSSFDLVLYSPPYLNNFDYNEVYKVEMWVLGFVKSYKDWQQVKLGSMRSHHSVTFPGTSFLANDPKVRTTSWMIELMSKSSLLKGYSKKNMLQVIPGYFDDIYLALKEQFRVLEKGGFLVYNVANSNHSYLPVATDLIISDIARSIGFIPLDLNVIHNRNGRTKRGSVLRESVVVMRKPD